MSSITSLFNTKLSRIRIYFWFLYWTLDLYNQPFHNLQSWTWVRNVKERTRRDRFAKFGPCWNDKVSCCATTTNRGSMYDSQYESREPTWKRQRKGKKHREEERERYRKIRNGSCLADTVPFNEPYVIVSHRPQPRYSRRRLLKSHFIPTIAQLFGLPLVFVFDFQS